MYFFILYHGTNKFKATVPAKLRLSRDKKLSDLILAIIIKYMLHLIFANIIFVCPIWYLPTKYMSTFDTGGEVCNGTGTIS